MTPRTPPRALQAEDIRLRRGRLRDAPRVGLVVARANEAQARDGRRRLNRVRVTSPPRPLRHGLLFVAATLTAATARGQVTNADVHTATGLDRSGALELLVRLVEQGHLERRGERRGAHYVLTGPAS